MLKKIRFILEAFHEKSDNTLTAYDVTLREYCGLSVKQMGRFLNDIAEESSTIKCIKIGKKNAYKLIKPVDVFVEIFNNSNDMRWLFHMAQEGNPEVFKALEEHTKDTKHAYQFKNTPFEDIATLEEKGIFKTLRRAVENREYAKITFKKDSIGKGIITRDNLKCLKLIFMDGNWYLAYVNEEDKCKLGRISFIDEVTYATKRGSFQPASVKKQMEFLDKIQNSMTLYGKEKKIARLKVTAPANKYFNKDMKPFFSSQKFGEVLDDGSVVFTIEYTQEMEILPFIQSWMPNLIILEPQGLKEAYMKKLTKTIKSHS